MNLSSSFTSWKDVSPFMTFSKSPPMITSLCMSMSAAAVACRISRPSNVKFASDSSVAFSFSLAFPIFDWEGGGEPPKSMKTSHTRN